jgi:hypothetical protein
VLRACERDHGRYMQLLLISAADCSLYMHTWVE